MEKKFDPTHKRLQELGKKGQVSRGKVLNRVVSFMVVFTSLLLIVNNRLQSIRQWSTECLEGQGGNFLVPLIDGAIIVIGPILAAIVVTCCLDLWAANWTLAKERGGISLSNFNPVEGLKGTWTRTRAIPFYLLCCWAFSLTLGAITCNLLVRRYVALATASTGVVGSIISDTCYLLGWGAGVGLTFGLLDGMRERFLFMKKNRMSLQDLKDEYKQEEGDLHMKALRRGIYEELMLANLEKRVKKSEFILIERSV